MMVIEWLLLGAGLGMQVPPAPPMAQIQPADIQQATDEFDFGRLIFAPAADERAKYAQLLAWAESRPSVAEPNPPGKGEADPYANACFEPVQANYIIAWRPRPGLDSPSSYAQARGKIVGALRAIKARYLATTKGETTAGPSLGAQLEAQVRVDQVWFGSAVDVWLELFPQATDEETTWFFSILQAKQCEIEADSVKLLTRLFKVTSWPDDAAYGDGASHAAWVLAQHADHHPSLQRLAAARLRRAASAGEASTADYALLQDRVQVRLGLPQVYGSQFHASCGGNVPYPILDEANVDERRKAVGLSSLEEYKAKIGRPCK
ncbi:MAG: hypothetical protein Q7T19_12725 [Caulobacter sp.]|nr:hypothetical protein [Caulobacter sp.]